MTTTSKLSNSIVFSRAIFWRPRADEMGAKGRRPRIRAKGRESRNTNTLKIVRKQAQIKSKGSVKRILEIRNLTFMFCSFLSSDFSLLQIVIRNVNCCLAFSQNWELITNYATIQTLAKFVLMIFLLQYNVCTVPHSYRMVNVFRREHC